MRHELPAQPAGCQARAVLRHCRSEQQAACDQVAEEVPVALVFNGIAHVVMMATPCQLDLLGIGFALTEGVVGRAGEIYEVEVEALPQGLEVRMTIAQGAFMQLKQRRRTLSGRTGCGVCGLESIALLDLCPERLPGVPALRSPALARAVERAAGELERHQAINRLTGGVHAAAWCGFDGAVAAVFEDVGRHNAMDKLVGHLAGQGASLQDGFVFLSSRASYELVRKAARVGIGVLATISAPTSLAIDIANQAGLTLLSFCRANRCVEYPA